MDMVIIACSKCGHTETYPHPESVPERKECAGCVAEGLIKDGFLYRLGELFGEDTGQRRKAESANHADQPAVKKFV